MKKIIRILRYKNYFLFTFAFILGCTFTLSFTNIERHFENQEIVEKSYLKNDDIESTFLVVLILSAPQNQAQRNAIRDTWLKLKPQNHLQNAVLSPITNRLEYDENGFFLQDTVNEQKVSIERFKDKLSKQTTSQNENVNLKIIHYFAVGTSGLSSYDLGEIMSENAVHNDLLILKDFHDLYANLTKKLLKSATSILKHVKFRYLLKTDDDSYVKLNYLVEELYEYDQKIQKKSYPANAPLPDLYWGYFNGRANIKRRGKWKENNFNLCGAYLPYALGGGYVLSYNLVKHVVNNEKTLAPFISEDISMGVWLSAFRNVYRRHDIRFDTGYLPRKCQEYHLILHKRTVTDMFDLHNGNLCVPKYANIANRPNEYFYDWTESPSHCCDNLMQ